MRTQQKTEYLKNYYQANKERILARNKALYLKRRSNPETLEKHRAYSTEVTRRYRLRHPERVKDQRKRVYDGRKRRAMEMLGGAICVKCGCHVLEFLEINHKNGGGCLEHRKNGGTATGDRLLCGKRSKDGLEVLCRVCNALDFLHRKNPGMAKRYVVTFTGNDREAVYAGAQN